MARPRDINIHLNPPRIQQPPYNNPPNHHPPPDLPPSQPARPPPPIFHHLPLLPPHPRHKPKHRNQHLGDQNPLRALLRP
ncbi:hypothetical protein M3J09_002505 [Ascochyta lentis]